MIHSLIRRRQRMSELVFNLIIFVNTRNMAAIRIFAWRNYFVWFDILVELFDWGFTNLSQDTSGQENTNRMNYDLAKGIHNSLPHNPDF